jgi:hypothetical protein
MSLTNNLKKQVDLPVWEWSRAAPGVSSLVSSTCSADNSLYHVTFGRYIYYMQAAATVATTTGLTGFFRYDTISDSYQMLAQPPLAPATFSGMQFAGGQGYYAPVLTSTTNTITAAALSGRTLLGFDIRIVGGTGNGQLRVITAVADAVIADQGTATAAGVSPQASIQDTNKNWTINQWAGYQVRLVSTSGQSQVRKILYNSSNTLFFADVAKFAEEPFAWNPITTIAGSPLVITAVGSPYQIESSVITVDSPWLTQPDSTSRFVVRSGAIWMLSSGTTYTLQYYDIAADSWYIRNAGAAASPVTIVGTDGTIVNSGENATVWDRGIALGTHSTTTLQDTTKSWAVNQYVGYYLRIFSGTAENQLVKITSNTSNTLTWVGAVTAPDNTSRYFIDAFDAGTLTSTGAMTQTGSSTGSINGNVFTAGATTGTYYPGQILTGTGVQSNVVILSPSLACFTSGNSTTVNFATGNPSTLGIIAGMVVTITAGAGAIPVGTTVSSVTSSTVVLSASTTTALSLTTLQFTSAWIGTTSSSTIGGVIVTTASTTGLYPGAYLTVLAGTGVITAGTYVASVIDSTHFTTSTTPTTALSAATIQAQPLQTVLQDQITGTPGGAGTYNVFPSQLVASTTIVGKGVGTVTDTTKSWIPEQYNNYSIRIKSGTGVGQTRQITRTLPGTVAYTSSAGATGAGTLITVSSTTNLTANMYVNITAGIGMFVSGTYVTAINSSTTFTINQAPLIALSGGATVVVGAPNNVLRVTPAWTVQPDSTSVYTITGDTDKNYFSLAGQTPTFVHNIDSDMVTTGRLLDAGVARGASAQLGDFPPVAVASGVPVLQITSAVGFLAAVATTGGSNTSNIATLTLTTAATSGVYPIGSWITVAGVTPVAYNGTWQVSNSGVGTVSFYSTTATGAVTIQGTVAQANSFVLGGTLASGAYSSLGAGTTVQVSGCVPVAYNGTLTVMVGAGGTTGASYGGYQSAAGATSSTTNVTVTDTTNLRAGMIPVVTAGTGSFAVGTVITSIPSSTVFVVSVTPSVALSGGASVVSVVPSFATTTITVAGNLTTLGVAQKVPQAPTAGSMVSTTATLTVSNTIFAVGSSIVISGCTPGTYNGVYSVTAASGGPVSYVPTNTPAGAMTVFGTVGLATTMQLVTTVNNHSFSTGMTLTHKGDQGFSASNTNVAGSITLIAPSVIGNATTQYTYPVSVSGPMVVYPQSTLQLQDSAKNWVPNQWVGCMVTYNSTQITGVAVPIQPTVLTAYIIGNTATTLIFAAAHSAAPVQGVSRYVITAPASYAIGNILGSQDGGLAQGVQSTTVLTDLSKSWATPSPIAGITGSSIAGGSATATLSAITGLYPGMVVAITLGNVALPAGTVINSINPATLVATMSNNFTGAGTTATFTFLAACSSAGNVITVSGYPLTNLAVGMYVGVTSTTNITPSVTTAGAFVANGGVNLTSVKVISINSATTFIVSATPTVALSNATVQASFWFPNQFINRRLRLISATGSNNLELVITANTFNTITTGIFGTAPVHLSAGYAILQQPVRGAGTALFWNFGSTNRKGKYLYQARGGNLTGWDRLSINNDTWEFLTPTPNFETINTGAMFAYDGVDRIYFTTQITQRVYYIDIDAMQIHPAGMYPYTAGTAIVGNRFEIFATVDGLKYLWMNRHSNVECFRQLLFY